MPETIIPSSNPLHSAIDKVLSSGYDLWKLTGWTTAGTATQPFHFHDQISLETATTGMSGTAFRPDGSARNFTIRHDWDYAKGGAPAGKGYHVNVELPYEKYAFTQDNETERKFVDCVQMLSERRLHDGDEMASRWFMTKIVGSIYISET